MGLAEVADIAAKPMATTQVGTNFESLALDAAITKRTLPQHRSAKIVPRSEELQCWGYDLYLFCI